MVAVLLSATKVVSTDWLLPLMLAVTFATPDLVFVRVVVAIPSASVVADAVVTVAPLVAVKVTATPETRLPLTSVTIAFTALVAVPLAFALSVVTVRLPSLMVAVPLSATKVVSTVWLAPLTLAVTFATPALVLLSVVVAIPLTSVVAEAVVIVAPLVAVKVTVASFTRLPFASVTIAFTALVAEPSAFALSVVTVRLPELIPAVLLSARKVVSTDWLLPLTVAVTLVIPDLLLVSVVVATPSASVVAEAVITVAPLEAEKLTLCPARTLPFASVTIAFTALVALPSAFALSVVTVRLPAEIVAVLSSATKCASSDWLLPPVALLTLAVTAEIPAFVLVSVVVATPLWSVVAFALATFAPLVALKLTTTPASGRPFASFTVAFTALVALPLAFALSVVRTKSPAPMVALLSSWAKWVSTDLSVPFTAAFTGTTPDMVLVRSVPAIPFSSVTADAVTIVAPLTVLEKLTVVPETVLPFLSVTFA